MRKSKKKKQIEETIEVFGAKIIILFISGIGGIGCNAYGGYELLGYAFSAAVSGFLVISYQNLRYLERQKKAGGKK